MVQLWAGIDAGKTHHHCVVIDADGTRLYSQRVVNDESVLLDLIADVVGLAQSKGGGEVVWATDLNHGGAALLIALVVADQARMRRDLQQLYFQRLSRPLTTAGPKPLCCS